MSGKKKIVLLCTVSSSCEFLAFWSRQYKLFFCFFLFFRPQVLLHPCVSVKSHIFYWPFSWAAAAFFHEVPTFDRKKVTRKKVCQEIQVNAGQVCENKYLHKKLPQVSKNIFPVLLRCRQKHIRGNIFSNIFCSCTFVSDNRNTLSHDDVVKQQQDKVKKTTLPFLGKILKLWIKR